MSSLTLNEVRLSQQYYLWHEHQSLNDAPILGGLVGSTVQVDNMRGVALVEYLFSSPQPVTDVFLIFTQKSLMVVCSSTAKDHFVLPKGVTSAGVSVILHSVDPNDAATLEPVKQFLIENGGKVAVAGKELALQEGAFAGAILTLLNHSSSDGICVVETGAPILGSLLEIKDDEAIMCIQKACALATTILKRFVNDELMNVLGGETITMDVFSSKVHEKIKAPNTISGLEALPPGQYDAAFLPVVIQSGGNYNLKVMQEGVSTSKLETDCIIMSYGVKHFGYSAYFSRTFLVENRCPPKVQEGYKFIVAVSNRVIELLRPGVRLCDVHQQAMATARGLNEEFASMLFPQLGFGTGLVVMEGRMHINEKNQTIIKPGMTFVVRVGLENIQEDAVEGQAAAAAGKKYSVLIGDTVAVRAERTDLFTKPKRELSDVLFQEEEEEEEDDGPTEQRDLTKITRSAHSGGTDFLSGEAKRREIQLRLLQEKMANSESGGAETVENAADPQLVTALGRLGKAELSSYGGQSETSTYANKLLSVDRSRDTAWIPVCGQNTPFHIATISKVDLFAEAGKHVLNIGFTNIQESNVAFRHNRTKVFIKGLTLRGGNGGEMYEFMTNVKEIQQKIKNQDALRKQNQGVVKQSGLAMSKTPPRLKSVKARPAPQTGKHGCIGDLEAHNNGFRFVYTGGDPIIVLLDNIKHIIFQPSANDIAVILHFTLKQPIMVGKRKSQEVQFIAEVLETSEGLSLQKKTYDEEIEGDERERDRIRKTNAEFMEYCRQMEPMLGNYPHLKVLTPFRRFEFTGCSGNNMVRFRAHKDAIWSVSEAPFYTVSLQEIEIVAMERVILGGDNFDMAFVYKGYKKPNAVITLIDMHQIENIKQFFCEIGMIYFESTINLSWQSLFKVIRDDEEWKPWGPHGWKAYIDPEAGSEEGEESDSSEDDTTYESSSEEDDESESDSDWAEEVSSSDYGSDSSDDSESSGLSWDEMERRAEAEDRRRNISDDSDSEEERKKKKRRLEAAKKGKGKGKK